MGVYAFDVRDPGSVPAVTHSQGLSDTSALDILAFNYV